MDVDASAPPAFENLEPRLLMSGSAPLIGMNLSSVSYWDEQWVFVDVMRNSMPWLSQDAQLGGPWNSGMPIQTDAAGWPILQPNQAAATLMMRNGGDYPGGQYVVNYEGTGTLIFSLDATVVSQTGNRMVLDVTPSAMGIFMRIETSDPNDHIRNISVTMPGFENSASPFHPLFTQRLEPFGMLRFMDFGATNNSTLSSWSDRTLPNSYTQGGVNGVSVEVMVDLANELGGDPWFNIPAEADDNFVQNFATVVRDQLDPNLNPHIEYSNEVWNGQFAQSGYANTQGMALGLSTTNWLAGLRYYSQRSVEIFNIWENVFGGTDRLVRVMGTQGANLGVSSIVMDWQDAYQHVDALAAAPYFSGMFGAPSRTAEVIQMSVDDILDEIELSLDQNIADQTQLVGMATGWGVDLVAYEGGQHMVGYYGSQDNAALTQKLIDTNRHPRMEQLYHKYLSNWANDGGGTFMAFNNVYAPSKWGSWGALEYQDQPIDDAPKYKGLLAAASGDLFVTGVTDVPTAAASAQTLTASGQSTYSFQVTYSDNVAIDVYELDSGDIRVLGPNGFDQLAVFDSVDVNSFGQTRTATYHVTSPSGTSWTDLDNGSYSVVVESGQVADTLGTAVDGGTIGSFAVSVPAPGQGPTANIVPIAPNPRSSSVNDVTVDFTADVLNVDKSDFALTRDGNAVNLSGLTVTPVTGSQFTLDLSSVTGLSGTYVLTLSPSDITDALGSPLLSGDADSWVTNTAGPTISSLALLDQGPGPAAQGGQMVLTAHDVDSASSVVTTLSFYADVDGDGVGQAGELLGQDTDGSDGWSWSGIGQDGSGYLAQATDGNGAVSAYSTVMAMDVVIGDGAYKSLEYLDADGTLVKVAFTGGTATVTLAGGQNLTSRQAKQGLTVSGQNLSIEQVETDASSQNSGLTFKTKNGDGLADVELISGATAVGKLAAKTINLTGAGIIMTGSGTFGSIQINDLVNGADVIMPGSAFVDGTSIHVRRIGNGTSVDVGSAVKAMKFQRWLSGQFSATWAGSITATGDRAAGISGDFGADVILTDAGDRNISLGKVSVDGNLVGGTWTVQGDIKSWKVNENATADITANCIHGAAVGGDAINLDLTLTHVVNPLDARQRALGKFKVKGWFDNSQIRSSGNVGAISVGASRDSVIHAGVAAGLAGTPASAADFDSLATIKSFKVKGMDGEPSSVTSTELAAWSIGQISLKDVTVNDPAQASAVVANQLNSYAREDGTTRYRWKSKQGVEVFQQVSSGMVTLVA